MPNWCNNSIAFYQEDGGNDRLPAFFADVQKYTDHKDPETGESSNWVGHLLKANGIDTNSLYARGFFSCSEFCDNHVRVDMETAWAPLPEVYDLIAEKYNLRYVYIAEEPGCEVYVNTDTEGRFFSTRYLLNSFEIDDLELDRDILTEYGERLRELEDETLYFDSAKEVLETFGEFKFCVPDAEILNQRLGEFNLHVYEYDAA